jgi:hypothetical protein
MGRTLQPKFSCSPIFPDGPEHTAANTWWTCANGGMAKYFLGYNLRASQDAPKAGDNAPTAILPLPARY